MTSYDIILVTQDIYHTEYQKINKMPSVSRRQHVTTSIKNLEAPIIGSIKF